MKLCSARLSTYDKLVWDLRGKLNTFPIIELKYAWLSTGCLIPACKFKVYAGFNSIPLPRVYFEELC